MAFAQTIAPWKGSDKELLGYYWSRKYNGMSVIWDGGISKGIPLKDIPYGYARDKKEGTSLATGLWTLGRKGEDSFDKPKIVNAPPQFLAKLPAGIPLHGELWKEDNLRYLRRYAKVLRPQMHKWLEIKFKVFAVKPFITFDGIEDFLHATYIDERFYLNNYTIYDYLDIAKKNVEENKHLNFIKMQKINSLSQVASVLQEIHDCEYEGGVFLHPTAFYENKRNPKVLKHKPCYENEATIVGYEEANPEKQHSGKVGAILVSFTWDDSVQYIHGGRVRFTGKTVNFSVSGLEHKERDWETCKKLYPIGGILRFSFNLISEGAIPQHCNIYRGI